MTFKELCNKIDKSDSNRVAYSNYVRTFLEELGLPGLDIQYVPNVEAYWFRRLTLPGQGTCVYTGSAIIFYAHIPVCYMQVLDCTYNTEECIYDVVCDFEWFDRSYPGAIVANILVHQNECKALQVTNLQVPVKEFYNAEYIYQLRDVDLSQCYVKGKKVYKAYVCQDASEPYYGMVLYCYGPEDGYRYIPINHLDIPIRLGS